MRFLIPVALACLVANPALSDTLTLRSGLIKSAGDDYIYSSSNSDQSEYDADYGRGGELAGIYRFDNLLYGHPVELSLSIAKMTGREDTNTPQNNDCDIKTYLGLIADCQDIAKTSNSTMAAEIAGLMAFPVGANGTEILAGAALLGVRDKLHGEYLYEGGYENFVDRKTTFTGAGVKFGLRQSYMLSNGGTFRIEGLAGAYRGNRKITINDTETAAGSYSRDLSTSESDSISVYSLEIRPSYSFAADWASKGAIMDVGASWRKLFNVADTRDTTGATNSGSAKDDISSASLFVSVTIPIN